MINSMTAYGRGVNTVGAVSVTVEIKSVNSRFFDCTIKMPRAYLALEDKLKRYIQDTGLTRGKVDVYVNVERSGGAFDSITVNTEYAKMYLDALDSLAQNFGIPNDITVTKLARDPEVLKLSTPESTDEDAMALLQPAFAEALASHAEMRRREGERIISDVKSKIESIRELAAKVAEISKTDTVGYRDKLEAKLRKILDDNSIAIDENRLLTECAIWCEKIAIDEELVRLAAHFEAFYEIISLPEPSGKKLDFLTQELNRETNTIGSKCNNSRIARIVVDMKGEIEKIREQIQNIE